MDADIECIRYPEVPKHVANDGMLYLVDAANTLQLGIAHSIFVFDKIDELQRTNIDVLVYGHPDDRATIAPEVLGVIRTAAKEADA